MGSLAALIVVPVVASSVLSAIWETYRQPQALVWPPRYMIEEGREVHGENNEGCEF